MILFLLLLAELLILFFVSRKVVELFYRMFAHLFRSRVVAISLTAAFFFPGTVIHELAHLFTAEVLGVRTGKLSLVPENLEEEQIQAGMVQIAKTDPFRRYAIGFAPLFVGLIVVTALSYWLMIVFPQVVSAAQNETLFSTPPLYAFILTAYLLFVVSDSMYSSHEDLKGFVGFAIAIGLMVAAGYIAGIRVGLTDQTIVFISRIFDSLIRSTGLVLAVNVILLLTLRILVDLSAKRR